MGAQVFYTEATGATSKEAFSRAVEDAYYDYGHGGYTGTIAEKRSFVDIPIPDIWLPDEAKTHLRGELFAEKLIKDDNPRVGDKWGPAGCVYLGNSTWLFFGWAPT